jgi:pimeloyl-ACP methyl ester carboxylesterase
VAPPSAAERAQSRRRNTAVLTAVAVCLLAAGAAVSWHFSSVLLVPNHSGWEPVDVEGVSTGRVVLRRDDETERPGVYGLIWRGGHAIAGEVLGESGDLVTRRLRNVDGYLAPGVDAWFDTDVYPGTPRSALGMPYRTASVHGELGPMPAWIVLPEKRRSKQREGDWAIVVHGINGDLQEGLRLVPAMRRLGMTSMLISYRDDDGVAESPDGLHHLGMTEWRDLEAAARYALGHGAKRLVLVGYSMGGAIVGQFMEHSPLAGRVSGLVLDAPVLDWRRVLEYNTTEMGLPAVAANPLEWAVEARIDVNWDDLDLLRHTDELRLPILLFQGTEDELVPIGLSEDFAAELPHWVSFYAVPHAGHTQSWNVAPALYERRLTNFLRPLDAR